MVLSAAASHAQGQGDREQVGAAVEDAIAALRETIGQESLGRGLIVNDLLLRADDEASLMNTLRRAQQIGGPRWIGDEVAQVRLEISGQRVAEALIQVAATNPNTSPLPADELAQRLRDWGRRTFSATGSSAGAGGIEDIRPADGGRWSDVPDDARRAAVTAAKQEAVQRVIDAVRPVRLPDGRRVEETLQRPEVGDRFGAWLASRPVTSVDFRNDLRVDVSLSAPPDEVFAAYCAALGAADEATWERVREQFLDRVPRAVGRGAVASSVPATYGAAAPPRVRIPFNTPEWAGDEIRVEGSAPYDDGKLKAARAAESRAIEDLRARIFALPLTSKLTLADAAELDPRVGQSLGRALRRARVAKVDYLPEGARVAVSLELRDVWDEVRAAR